VKRFEGIRRDKIGNYEIALVNEVKIKNILINR